LKTPNGEPEQLQIKPTLMGAAVAWADDGLADEALPAAEVGEVELDDEDLLLDEHATRAKASATTPPSVDQRLRLILITLDLLTQLSRIPLQFGGCPDPAATCRNYQIAYP
jgi:hypothetical protein